MPAKSYTNEIEKFAVTIGLQQLLIAPEGTAYAGTKIDITTPPAGFIPLGAVVEDAPQVTISKEKFQLRTGIPRVLVYEAVVGLAGEIQTVFHSYLNFHAFMGAGGPKPLNVRITAHDDPNAPTVSAAPAPTRTSVAISNITAVVVGMRVATDSDSNLSTTYNKAFVKTITPGTSPAGTLTLSGTGFPFVPVVGQKLVALDKTKLLLGSSQVPYFRLLAFADLLNEAQVVFDFQRVTPRGNWQEKLVPGQNVIQPAVFDLEGYTVAGYGTADELGLAERIDFNPTKVA